MAELTLKEKEALSLFKQRVMAAFPDSVDAIQLFGSKARGDAAKHSDVDVLVVLDQMTWQDKRAIRALASEIIFTAGVLLSVQIFSRQQLEQMKQRHAIFWQTIEPDLMPL